MGLFEAYNSGFEIGFNLARFFIGAGIGGCLPMIFFFFSRKIFYGLLSFLVCGLFGFVGYIPPLICGAILTVLSVAYYISEKKKAAQEAAELDEKVRPEWENDCSETEPSDPAQASSAGEAHTAGADGFRTEIAGWQHRIKRYPDGRFNIWHHVTESDKGYGTEVNFDLPADFFSEHTAEDFYECIADRHICVYGNRERELEALKSKLISRGWTKE